MSKNVYDMLTDKNRILLQLPLLENYIIPLLFDTFCATFNGA